MQNRLIGLLHILQALSALPMSILNAIEYARSRLWWTRMCLRLKARVLRAKISRLLFSGAKKANALQTLAIYNEFRVLQRFTRRFNRGLGIETDGIRRWAPWRALHTSRELFMSLEPPEWARTQHVEVSLPIMWDRNAKAKINDARFVTLIECDSERQLNADTLRRVIAILISGRPIVNGPHQLARMAVPLSALAFTGKDIIDFYRASNHELHQVALKQLRMLIKNLQQRPNVPELPTISVVVASCRPSQVRKVLRRLQAQQGVHVRLHLGCHGFNHDMLGQSEILKGAIKHAELQTFEKTQLLGEVLALLTRDVKTELVAKLDDDDFYGPHHLYDLSLFTALSGRGIVGKGGRFLLFQGTQSIAIRKGGKRYGATNFLAGGALIVFKPLILALGNWGYLSRGVDQDLIERFLQAGLETLQIHEYEFVIVRHEYGHTWNPELAYFESRAECFWSADFVYQLGIVEDPTEYVGHAKQADTETLPEFARLSPRHSVAVCVSNKDNHPALRLAEQQARQLSNQYNNPQQSCGRPSSNASKAEFILCDDRSNPPLRGSTASLMHIVRLNAGEGFGLARARNAAVKASSAEVLVFMDDDIYLEPKVVPEILGWFERGFQGVIHAEIAFTNVSVQQLLAELERNPAGVPAFLRRSLIPGQDWRQPHWVQSCDLAHPRSSSYRATVGGFFVCDRDTFFRAGEFRDMSEYGGEDTEFGYRAMLAGAEQRVYRGDGIWHLGQRTIARGIPKDVELSRQQRMRTFIPIWDPSLSERSTILKDYQSTHRSFAELAPAGVEENLDPRWARAPGGRTGAQGRRTNVLDAPFAIGWVTNRERLPDALEVAHDRFRNHPCGQVLVKDCEGNAIANFYALWALNLAANRMGLSAFLSGMPCQQLPGMLVERVRSDFGWATAALENPKELTKLKRQL